MSQSEFNARRSMPVLALRGLSVFPGMLLNFDVERPMSVAALNMAMGEDQVIFPHRPEGYDEGPALPGGRLRRRHGCRVRQLLRQPGGKSIRVMVEGIAAGASPPWRPTSPASTAEIDPEPDIPEKALRAHGGALPPLRLALRPVF